MVETQTAPDNRGKRRTTIALLSACLAVGLAILGYLLLAGYSEDKAAAELRAGELAIRGQLWYADLLHMDVGANPDVDATIHSVNFKGNLGMYTRVEFVMELPSLERRAPGVLYFAPDEAGRTQKDLGLLNDIIENDPSIALGKGLEYPLTLPDVIGNYDGVKAVFDHMNVAQLSYFKGVLKELPTTPVAPETLASQQPKEG
ncbi:MAG: hypothetical protein LBP24_00605 [Coriobacteriales bacterium]|nr:hypothetical protein [Coriobacteriales bacterium]